MVTWEGNSPNIFKPVLKPAWNYNVTGFPVITPHSRGPAKVLAFSWCSKHLPRHAQWHCRWPLVEQKECDALKISLVRAETIDHGYLWKMVSQYLTYYCWWWWAYHRQMMIVMSWESLRWCHCWWWWVMMGVHTAILLVDVFGHFYG